MMHGDTDDNLLADEYVAQQHQDYLGAMYAVAGTNYGDDTALYHHLHDQHFFVLYLMKRIFSFSPLFDVP